MTQFDHLREKLADYRVPVDTDALWAKTAHAIPRRRRRRPLLFWLVGAVLVALVAIYTGREILSEPSASSAGSSLTQVGEGAPVTAAETKDGPTVPNQIGDSPASSQTQTPGRDDVHAGNGKIPTQQMKGESSAKKSAASDPEGSSNIAISETNKRETFDNAEKSLSSGVVDRSVNMMMPVQITGDSEITAPTSSMTAVEPILDDQNNVQIVQGTQDGRAEWPVEEDRPVLQALDALPTLVPLWQSDLSVQGPQVLPSPEWSKPKLPVSFSLLLTAGIGGSAVDVRAEHPEDEEEAMRWEESIRSLEYLSAALQGNMHFAERWHVGVSLDYGRLVTEQTYMWETTGRVNGTGTSDIIINEDGSQNLVSGEVTGTRTSTIQSTRFNTHQTLGLEAVLGYSVWRRKGFDLLGWVSGGVNYWYRVSGAMPNPAWEPVPIPSTQAPFSLATPFTWAVGMDAQWYFSRHGYARIRASLDQLGYVYEQNDAKIDFQHRMGSFSLGAGYVW